MESSVCRVFRFCIALALWAPLGAFGADIAQTPLFLTKRAEPLVMLNLSRDHQLYFKAYNDYTDLDGDGTPDTTYKHSVDYYGYFDSYKCYSYTSSRFEPQSVTTNKYCSGQWSGNFLNWATMARIDTVRKILYGGHRSTDSAGETVLERTYLPNDAHSFAKYYNGADVSQLTPFSPPLTDPDPQKNGLTLCNTTVNNGSALSQNVTDPPLLRVAKGNYSLWVSNERWQCRWSGEQAASNGNDALLSGIAAASSNPSKTSEGLGGGDFTVRVKACVAGLLGTETCKRYPGGNYKPVGLMQLYGDEDQIFFGLLTGSYGKNKSGGVLRKNISSFTDEVNTASDGTFKTPPTAGNVVNTLNKLRIYGYSHGDGRYSPGDNCDWGLASFSDGDCSNWGNPQAEIFLESLRYLAGKSPTAGFAATDSSRLPGLPTAAWTDPLSDANWCAPLSTINFNASMVSYDGDQLAGASDLNTGSSATALTDAVGSGEGISGNYFVGSNGIDNNQLCTPKAVTSLGSVSGICAEAPRLSGTYKIAGLAHHARTGDLRPDLDEDQQVTTYGVALAPASPRIEIPVPGSLGQKVTILPACRNSTHNTNCSLVEFKIVAQDLAAGTGKFYVNWEDSEQGGDFDQDMWGTISYTVTAASITVTTDVYDESTPYAMGFGYVISGTSQDGFHVHSGVNGFNYTDAYAGIIGCSSCQETNPPTSVVYSLGVGTAQSLKQPLYYASKWGGFEDSDDDGVPNLDKEWDADLDGVPDTYFFATDPAELAAALGRVFETVAKTRASSAAVTANSVALETGTHIYQARFDSETWGGELLALPLGADGSILDPAWEASAQLDSQDPDTGRAIITLDPAQGGIAFRWASLSAAQQALLDAIPYGTGSDGLGERRLDWLRGQRVDESLNGGPFRDRFTVLGDVVSSKPVYVGKPLFRYPSNLEGSSHASYTHSVASRHPMIYLGANDGMLHAFDALTGDEKLAYVPNRLLGELNQLTSLAYDHRYFVDGISTAADVFIGGAWRTVLVGSMGGGGRGYFALDVTDPSRFSEINADELVLWEFSDLDDNQGGVNPDLGHTYSQAAVVKLQNGAWAAVFGNGYHSDTGKAALYIVDIATGQLIKRIDADSAGGNGLSTPAPVDLDGDFVVDVVFAGDLKGNLWRFDLDDPSPAQWQVAYQLAGVDKPLYQARDAADNPQPITMRPEVSLHPYGGVIVLFGTGQYYEVGDIALTDPQTVYGIWDDGQGRDFTRSDLVAQQVLATVSAFGGQMRVTSKNPIQWYDGSSGQSGWYLDLPVSGERQVTNAILRNGRLIFTTLIPSSHACDFGGTGWLMELDYISGGRLDYTPFDFDGDGEFDADDYVNVPFDVNNDGLVDGDDLVAVSGKESTVGIIQTPTIIDAGDREFKYASGTKNAGIDVTVENPSGGEGGRQSWQQLLPVIR